MCLIVTFTPATIFFLFFFTYLLSVFPTGDCKLHGSRDHAHLVLCRRQENSWQVVGAR